MIQLKINNYNIDFEKAVKEINKKGYKKVVIQFPEGLKNIFSDIVQLFEKKTDATIIMSGDPCYGACDLVESGFLDMGIDFVIQIGHEPIPNISNMLIPTLFLVARADQDISTVINKALPKLSGKKIGILTTAQHLHKIDEIKKILQENGFETIIGKGDSRINKDGQILGCNFSSATTVSDKVDIFIYVGSGTFHPLGLLLSTKKPVIMCNPYTNEIKTKELDDLKDMTLRQRYGAIARSKDANNFGILIGTKKGKQRYQRAIEIKKNIEDKGKKAFFIMQNYFITSFLEGFRDIDCFVSVACPRIAIDDYMQYKIPILTPIELEILLGLKKWDDYIFDNIK